MAEQLLKIKDIAQRLNIERNTPYRWIQRGHLRAIRTASGMVRVKQSDFEAFLAGRTPTNEETKKPL